MDNGKSVRIWLREDIPERFRHLTPNADETGIFVVFVAHVPDSVLAGPTYRLCNGESNLEGWMREGECGLFGINALDVHPDPEGDGILIVGSCV